MLKSTGLNKLEIESYHDYNTLLQSGVFECLTLLDIYSLKWLSASELKSLLYNAYESKDAKVDRPSANILNEPALLARINQVYLKTIDFLESNLLLKIPKQYKNKQWKNVDEFIAFLKWLTSPDRKGYEPVIECAILKTMNAVHDVIDNPHLSWLEKKLDHTISCIVKKNKRLISKFKTETEELFIYNAPTKEEESTTNMQNPEIRVVNRVKQLEKIVQKNIGERKYSSVNLLKDIIGVRIEVSNCSEAQIIELMVDIAQSVFWSSCEFDQKNNFLSPDAASKLLEKIPGLIVRNGGMNAKSDKNYQDAKFIGEVKWHKNGSYSAEIQFVHIDNRNESGFSNHHVLDMKKVLTNVARLFWTLTTGNIKVAIQSIGLKSGITEKAILNHLFFPASKDAIWFLIPLRMANGTIRFTTKNVYKDTFHKLYKWFPKVITDHINGNAEDDSKEFNYKTFLKEYDRIKI